MKKIILSILAVASLGACQNELYRDNVELYQTKQGAYVSDASTQVFIQNGKSKEVNDLTISLALKPESPYKVEVQTGDPAALEAYNKRYGTSYELLPQTMYESVGSVEFPSLTSTVSYPIKLKDVQFKPGVTYALPVSIVGCDAIPGQAVGMLTIDPLTVTKVPSNGAATAPELFPEGRKFKVWTIEMMVKRSAYAVNNQALFWTTGNAQGGVDEIYARFGDVTIQPNQIQLKTAGSNNDVTSFNAQENEWYMISMSYDGKTCRIYVDGNLMYSNDISPNVEYLMKGFTVASSNQYVREVRFYKTVRTSQQIADFVWKPADYSDDNLLFYLPMNGKKIDHTTGQITDDETKAWDWSKNGYHFEWIGDPRYDDNGGDLYTFPINAE